MSFKESLLDVSARTVRNVGYTVKGSWGRTCVDPRAIEYVQSPEWRLTLHRNRKFLGPASYVRPGNWDRVAETRHLYLGGPYEDHWDERERCVVPMDRYAFYQALRDRFLDGRRWEDTEWYQWIRNRLAAGRPVGRYESESSIEARLRWLDELCEDMTRNGYGSQRVLHYRRRSTTIRYLARRVFGRPFEEHEPFINVGRDGRLILEDGRHRLCTAKVVGVEQVEVNVLVTHSEAEVTG